VRKIPRSKRLLTVGVAAACIAAATVVVSLNPRGVENIADALRTIRGSDPAPPPAGPAVAGMGEDLPGVSMAALAGSPDAEPAAADTLPVAPPAPIDSGRVLESSTGRFSLPNAEETRKAEMEKAKMVQQPLPPVEKAPEPPAKPVREKGAPPAEIVRVEATATGFVDITVEPTAEILVDGRTRVVGGHLAMLEIPAGTHEISCRSEGYRDYLETVQIKRGELSRRFVTLERLAGTLAFETEAGTQIFVDGAFKGTVPLGSALDVPVGTHRIELKKAGFQTWTSAVYVPRDETVRLAISLVPLSAGE